MTKTGWFSRLSRQRLTPATAGGIAGGIGAILILMMTGGIATAQAPAPEATPVTAANGYTIHQSVDLGGHLANVAGSGAMYDTLVNEQSGPRVLGETFEMRALPGTQHTLFDSLSARGSGFGGDPYSFAKMDFYKGKLYEFSGLFRRDRQYFDYDLLGNPNIPSGQSIPIGPTAAPTGSFAWPQVLVSPFMFNTVRRMTDTNLTILPLSKVTFRAAYSQNILQGPSLSPSGYQFAKYNAVLQEMQRNSTDTFIGGMDWKPVRETRLTFEEEIAHYKANSYFTLNPAALIVQEPDGTKAAINDYDGLAPYGASACNANSIGTTPLLSAPQTPGGLPVINPACAVVTNYLRSQPTRFLYPTEILRLQSSTIPKIAMNGDFRYTQSNMNLAHYYDGYQGLNGTTRSLTYQAYATAKRDVVAADYGITWQATSNVSFADQVDYSSVHQPGVTTFYSGVTLATPATAGNETINYAGALIRTNAATGGSTFEGSPAVGVPGYDYFGQNFLTNNLTATWDGWSRATISLTYRYRQHVIAEGVPHTPALAVGADTNGTVTINENGGILNAALRPSSNWNINGSVEVLYDDNAFTPVGPRQTQHYRIHTTYKPSSWMTLSAAYNDVERHNNTNNNQAAVAAKDVAYAGPIAHVDYSRVGSVGAVLMPNDRYGFDFNYSYNDVYTATNTCFDSAASATLAGAESAAGIACPGATVRGATYYEVGPVKDFIDAPTQSGAAALRFSPAKTLKSGIGYRISSVNGTQFFNDPRAVNGSLVSTYQSPFVNLAYTVHPGWIWKAEYNFYGYGEGGPSGAAYCATNNPTPTTPATVVPCASLSLQTGRNISPAGETAPRNFHANNVTIGMHYEF